MILFKRYYLFLLFFIIVGSSYGEKYVKINPRDCTIVSFVEGDFRNIEIIHNRYLVKISSRNNVYEYKIYSLDEFLYVPFENEIKIEVKDLNNNTIICSQSYNNLVFPTQNIDLRVEIEKYKQARDALRRRNLNVQIFLLSLPMLIVGIIIFVLAIIKKR